MELTDIMSCEFLERKADKKILEKFERIYQKKRYPEFNEEFLRLVGACGETDYSFFVVSDAWRILNEDLRKISADQFDLSRFSESVNTIDTLIRDSETRAAPVAEILEDSAIDRYRYQTKAALEIIDQLEVLGRAYKQGHEVVLCVDMGDEFKVLPFHFKDDKEAAAALIEVSALNIDERTNDYQNKLIASAHLSKFIPAILISPIKLRRPLDSESLAQVR